MIDSFSFRFDVPFPVRVLLFSFHYLSCVHADCDSDPIQSHCIDVFCVIVCFRGQGRQWLSTSMFDCLRRVCGVGICLLHFCYQSWSSDDGCSNSTGGIICQTVYVEACACVWCDDRSICRVDLLLFVAFPCCALLLSLHFYVVLVFAAFESDPIQSVCIVMFVSRSYVSEG